MRTILLKYEGECRKCGAALPVGSQAGYEKRVGVFCVGCMPTDSEEIRAYRQGAADRRADRYEEWAEKREARANRQLNSYPEIRHDWAFITQPGHIPFRDAMNRSDDRAHESLNVASGFRAKASSLRHVRVAGDAERKREAIREKLDTMISKGSRVVDACFGAGEVIGVYKKSYRIRFDRGCTYARDKSYVRPEA